MNNELCPGCSGNSYTVCCQPYLAGRLQPKSAEQLMRSRYSAFCQGQIDYLVATRHPSQQQADDRQTVAHTIATTEWVGLRVIQSDQTENMGSAE